MDLLGECSEAIEAGDERAVFALFSPDLVSQVTDRVNPDGVESVNDTAILQIRNGKIVEHRDGLPRQAPSGSCTDRSGVAPRSS